MPANTAEVFIPEAQNTPPRVLQSAELIKLSPSPVTNDLAKQSIPHNSTASEPKLLDQETDIPEETAAVAETELIHGGESNIESNPARESSLLRRISGLRVVLRFHRADLYLGLAVLFAAFALFWPATVPARQNSLSLWDKTLITLGIAEAPAPAVHFQGDPAIEVWIDPHTALYYCPGEEQYGKTPDGRYSPQRDAQTDRFEPANRSACE
jgi:hypothetical protein